MKQFIYLTFILVTISSFYSCATLHINVSKPASSTQNFLIVDENFEETWKAVVEYSSRSFFAIKTYEKNSGLLTLDFSVPSSLAKDYVDCGSGTVERTFQFYPFIIEPYTYNGALLDSPVAHPKLGGVINIFIKPIGKQKTKIEVNARYIFDLLLKDLSVGFNIEGEYSFNSQSEGQSLYYRNVQVHCIPTLKAETDIINGIKSSLK